MRGGLLIGLLFGNMLFGALAVTPNLDLSPALADGLHFLVAAVDTFAFGLLFRRPAAVAGIIFSICAFVELLQSSIPGRTASLDDLSIDVAGVLVGLIACHLVLTSHTVRRTLRRVRRRIERRRQSLEAQPG